MPSIDRFLLALFFLAVAFVVSTVAVKLLGRAKFLTARTATTLDDAVLRAVTRPIHLGFLAAGFLAAWYYLFPDARLRGYGFDELAFVVISILVAYTADRLVRGMLHWYEEQSDGDGSKGHKGVFGFLETMVSVLLWGFAVLFVLKRFGVDVSTLFAGLGIAGLAVALALQNTLSGVFSALYIAVDKPIRAGDFIRLDDGTEGFVEDISLRSTRIRTFSNNYVIVPNTKLAGMVIINYYLPEEEIGILVPCGVSYDSDLAKVEETTLRVAREVLAAHGGVEGFEPLVRYNAFGDSAITFNVILQVKHFTDQYVFKHEFIKALKAAYDAEGIEIPFPQMDVHLRKDA